MRFGDWKLVCFSSLVMMSKSIRTACRLYYFSKMTNEKRNRKYTITGKQKSTNVRSKTNNNPSIYKFTTVK